MAADDFYSLFLGEPSAQAQAQALAEALRQRRGAGDFALLTGDKVLGNFGQAALQQAGQEQQLLAQAGNQRLQRALEAQRMANDQAYRQQALGLQRQQMEMGKYAQGQWGVLNTKTGELESVAGPGGSAPMNPKLEATQWKQLQDILSTGQGRGNINKEQQELLNRAGRLEALVLGPGGQIQNLTPQQVREASTSLAALISKGSASLGQIEELTPHTLAGQFANFKQKYLNEPQGADAQAFLQNILETAGREKAVVLQQLRAQQMQSLPNYAHLRGRDRTRFDSMLKSAGLDPAAVDDRGLPVQAAPATGGNLDLTKPAATSEDQQAIDWARANPKDKRAAAILAAHGLTQ